MAYDSHTTETTPDEGGNGAFVHELLAVLKEPDKLLITCLNEVADAVRKKTNERQIPSIDYGGFFNDFFLQAQTSLYKSEDIYFDVIHFDKQ
jgi:hypothetical protein